jgi:hypothetical protein
MQVVGLQSLDRNAHPNNEWWAVPTLRNLLYWFCRQSCYARAYVERGMNGLGDPTPTHAYECFRARFSYRIIGNFS